MMATPIYHITHVNNLARIVNTNGLWCDSERLRQGFESVGIAHQELKDRRARTSVRRRTGQPIAAGGTLADYVPFHFANRSPMLYSIHTGYVEGYDGGQRGVVYLVSSVQRVAKGDRPWCFTNGHAVQAVTEFFDSLADWDKVDWDIVGHWRWKDTDADPDRKRRKQAEFLVHKSVPWDWVEQIGVIDRAMHDKVKRALADAGVQHVPPVVVQRKWYYD
jgi:ssDNA thymidine ADP-ribosyltransferase, DarT